MPHVDMTAARDELRHLRVTLGAIAAEHGLAIMAAGTHPTAALSEPQPSAAAAERALQRSMRAHCTSMSSCPIPRIAPT